MGMAQKVTYEEVETKFDVGDRVEYLNQNTNAWEPVTITDTGYNDCRVVYGNDGGHWGYEDQYRSVDGSVENREKVRECQMVFGRLEAGCLGCSFRTKPEMCAFDRYDVPENQRKRWLSKG